MHMLLSGCCVDSGWDCNTMLVGVPNLLPYVCAPVYHVCTCTTRQSVCMAKHRGFGPLEAACPSLHFLLIATHLRRLLPLLTTQHRLCALLLWAELVPLHDPLSERKVQRKRLAHFAG